MLFKHMLFYGRFFSPDNGNGSGGGSGAGSESGSGDQGGESGESGGSGESEGEPGNGGEDVSGLKASLKAVREEKKALEADLRTVKEQLNQLSKPNTNKPGDQQESELEKQIADLQKKFDDIAAEKQKSEDAKARAAAVKAEKLDESWADLIAGKDPTEWAANAKRIRELISKSRNAPDTNTGHQSKGPKGSQDQKAPEFKFRARGKQVTVS